MELSDRLHDRCACGSSLSSYRPADGLEFVLPGTERVYERSRPFAIEHIALDWHLHHGEGALDGTAELSLRRATHDAEELVLDAVQLDIATVELKSGKRYRAAPHVYDGETLRVRVPGGSARATVRVRYRATPRRGMYFLAPDEQVPDRPEQLWTQCQDEDARWLFPCHDKPHVKQTMDIRVRVRPGWRVLSNGDLASSRADQRRGHFHFKMRQPQSSYLFTLVAGDFRVVEDRVGDVPVAYWVQPGREQDARRTFGRTPDMIRLFARLTGVPYPWTKYVQVVVNDFFFGGMENTGATTMYEHILLDERAAIDVDSDYLIAHELAHQWFGDLVTCRDWSHAWLNEGFATYFEHIWREHHLGRDEYDHGLRADLSMYLGEAEHHYRRPVVCHDYEAPIDIFDRHLYEKGALVLHALRRALGDDDFWRGVNRYLRAHASGVAETRDLRSALEEVSGRSLEALFEQLLFRAGHARLDVSLAYEGKALVATVKQRLDEGARPFAAELEVDIGLAGGGVRRERRRVNAREHVFVIPVDERPRFVVVDPELCIVGRVAVECPADMLRRQLAEAPTARGRVLAAELLGKRDDPATVRALGEALAGRGFWGLRAVVAGALGNVRSPAAFQALAAAVKTRHPKVRRAVVQALGQFRSEGAAKVLLAAARNDASVLVAATAARALGQTKRSEGFEALVEMLDRPSWADSLRVGAIEGLAHLRDKRALEHVAARAHYGFATRGRRAAIAALPELSQSRRTRERLEELFDDRDPLLRGSVCDALAELGDVKARSALQRQLERDLDGRVRRRIREVLRELAAKGTKEQRRLRDDLEQLRRDHGELRARLSKLEQKARATHESPKASKRRKRR